MGGCTSAATCWMLLRAHLGFFQLPEVDHLPVAHVLQELLWRRVGDRLCLFLRERDRRLTSCSQRRRPGSMALGETSNNHHQQTHPAMRHCLSDGRLELDCLENKTLRIS